MNERRCRRTIGSCRNARTVADERVASAECRKEDDDGATHVAIPQPILDALLTVSVESECAITMATLGSFKIVKTVLWVGFWHE